MSAIGIFDKYAQALIDLGMDDDSPISADAILLALRLAIGEAYDASVPESAWVAAQNEIAMLRQQLAVANHESATRGDQLAIERREVRTLIEEIESLRQQLAQLDADNADLTRKLAAANAAGANSNGHVKGAVVEVTSAEISARRMAADANAELADYWESLDKGRRTFRQLEKRIRLDLVQTALASFAEMPTQSAFNTAKPEWMPTATGLCTAFGCKWEELPTLKWEQVKA